MRKLRGEPDLAKKTVSANGLCDIGTKHLERNVAIVTVVSRQINRRHPTSAQLSFDSIGKSFDRHAVECRTSPRRLATFVLTAAARREKKRGNVNPDEISEPHCERRQSSLSGNR
jgi:hypothetical protein